MLPAARGYQEPVLRSAARFKLLVCGRRWGKTKVGLLAATVGHGPKTSHGTAQPLRPGALHGARIAWIVPSEDHPSAGEIWTDLKAALAPSVLAKRHVSESHKKITLPGGGSVQVWSGFVPNTLRGPYFDGVVVDECGLQDERLWHALRPTLSDYQGWALLLGTVPEDVARHWFVSLHRYAASEAGRVRGWETWRRPSSDNPQLTKSDLEEARETLGARTYMREYEAELVGHEGGVWKEEWFRFYEEPLPAGRIQRLELFLDAAWKTGVRNDYSCCQLWARTRSAGSEGVGRGGEYYLLAELHGKWESPELRRRVAAFREVQMAAYPGFSMPLVVEAAGGGVVAAQELRAALEFPVIEHELKGMSKLARADLVTPLAEGGKVFLPAPGREAWVREVIQEVVGFPNLAHDDRHDVVTMALHRLSRHREAAHAYVAAGNVDLDRVAL